MQVQNKITFVGRQDPVQLFLLAIFLAGVYFLLFQLMSLQVSGGTPSDTPKHLSTVDEIFGGQRSIPHAMWHGLVWLGARIFQIENALSASLVTAAIFTIYTLLIYLVCRNQLQGEIKREPALIALVLIIILAGPFTLPVFSDLVYRGYGSPNIWHNVTLFMVKPFALVSLFFTVRYFQTFGRVDAGVAFIATILSIFAKPSYIIVYLPTLYIFLLARDWEDIRASRGNYFRQYLVSRKQELAYVLAVSIMATGLLLYQLSVYVGQDNGSIIVSYLGLAIETTPNIFFSVALVNAFPLAVIFICKTERDDFLLFSLVLLCFSVFARYFFAETGPRASHGNFSWSFHIATQLIFIFAIIRYIKSLPLLGAIQKTALSGILAYQVYVGVYYLAKILHGSSYFNVRL